MTKVARRSVQNKSSKRDAIIQAAIDCFGKRGVSQTSLRDIAQKAHVDPPLILYYFPSIEALYHDVFAVILEHLREGSLRPLKIKNAPSTKLMAEYVRAPFELARKNPAYLSIWLYFYYLCSFQKRFYQINEEIRRTGRERIAVMIYQGIEKGEFKLAPGVRVEATARTIQGLMTGSVTLYLTEGARDDSLIEETVEAVLFLIGSSG